MISRTRALLATTTLLAGAATAAVVAAAPANASTPACGNRSLAVTGTRTEGATGHGSFVLRFENVTSRNCSLYGYPGLDALNGHGVAIKHARRTLYGFAGGSHTGIRTVVLKPGHYASATVEWLNFNPTTAGSCTFSHSVATTPANTSHTVILARSVSVCDLQVHPTVPGRTGNS